MGGVGGSGSPFPSAAAPRGLLGAQPKGSAPLLLLPGDAGTPVGLGSAMQGSVVACASRREGFLVGLPCAIGWHCVTPRCGDRRWLCPPVGGRLIRSKRFGVGGICRVVAMSRVCPGAIARLSCTKACEGCGESQGHGQEQRTGTDGKQGSVPRTPSLHPSNAAGVWGAARPDEVQSSSLQPKPYPAGEVQDGWTISQQLGAQ